MKTFKQHINIKESLDGGTLVQATLLLKMVLLVFTTYTFEVLKRVNAFLGGTASKEYINASHAVEEIRNKR